MIFPIASRVQDTNIFTLRPGQEIHEEGLAMVFGRDAGGTTYVQPSTGTGIEMFAGVSMMRNTVPSMLAYVGNYIVPTNNTVQLPRTPIAGQFYASIDGVPLNLTAGAPTAPDQAQLIPGDQLLLYGVANATVYVQFKYNATVAEAQAFQGQPNIPGAVATNVLGELAVITKARIATSCFDAGADWSQAGVFVKFAANGLFTVGDAQNHLSNAVLLAGPSAGNGYIQLNLNNSL